MSLFIDQGHAPELPVERSGVQSGVEPSRERLSAEAPCPRHHHQCRERGKDEDYWGPPWHRVAIRQRFTALYHWEVTLVDSLEDMWGEGAGSPRPSPMARAVRRESAGVARVESRGSSVREHDRSARRGHGEVRGWRALVDLKT